MGIDNNFPKAFLKSQIASGNNLPRKGNVFISVKDEDKENVILMSQMLIKLGFKLVGTTGTSNFLKKFCIDIKTINKVREGQPHILDIIEQNKINLIINTTQNSDSLKDSLSIRRSAIKYKIPYVTTISAAKLAISSINTIKKEKLEVKSLQEYYKL